MKSTPGPRMKRPSAVSLNSLHTMQATKSGGTGPEIRLRAALRAAGLRGYRVNLKGVPGRPDIAFPRYKLAVFVHGCFWHRCPYCQPPMPKRNRAFWRQKFEENAERDERTRTRLERAGWTVLELQECEVEGDLRKCVTKVQRAIVAGPELASPE